MILWSLKDLLLDDLSQTPLVKLGRLYSDWSLPALAVFLSFSFFKDSHKGMSGKAGPELKLLFSMEK